MKKILVLGAGQSAPFLISFLLEEAKKHNWFVSVADRDYELARKRVAGHSNGIAIEFDVNNVSLRNQLIKEADIVVNLLTPTFQYQVALDCVKHGKHVVTASYTDPRVQDLNNEALQKGVLILNEMGLDPGIDHMSAMRIVEKVKEEGGEITGFLSYGSAVPKPSKNMNPFGYYITWNPSNVVTAAESGAIYLENGKKKVLSQQKVFRRTWEVEVEGVGTLEAYPNRDSLIYMDVFDLPKVETMIRATLRYPGYAEVWRQIILLGMPNERINIPNLSEMTYKEFTEMFIAASSSGNEVKKRVANCLGLNPTGTIMQKLDWLGLFSDEKIGGNPKTAVDVMVKLLSEKLAMPEDEQDMVVLMHQIDAKYPNGEEKRCTSTMVEYGDLKGFTAIARTVGMPAAIATKLILLGELYLTGVQIPTHPAIYHPVLQELKENGIQFTEKIEIKK